MYRSVHAGGGTGPRRRRHGCRWAPRGVVELELVSTGERWGRGPKHDVHYSLEATVDSPTWHLVQALNRLIKADGHTPAVEGVLRGKRSRSPTSRRR